MCGIAGALVRQRSTALEDFIGQAMGAMRQRGPDAAKVEQFRDSGTEIAIGCTRLRITDQSPTADQPMTRGHLSVALNGAIYNHVEIRKDLERAGAAFTTNSDTETFIAAFRQWGVGAFGRLQGMFSAAILDRKTAELVIVRDRFGVKPLYYAQSNGFWFASIPEPLSRHLGSGPDLDYVSRGLRFRVFEIGDEGSPYLGIRSLPPGAFGRISLAPGSQIRVERYYELSERVATTSIEIARLSAAEKHEEVCRLLREATRARLQAEVPQALMVSGGLDSSSVAALSAEEGGSPLVAYHYGAPSRRETEAKYVEVLRRSVPILPVYVFPQTKAEASEIFLSTLEAQGAPYNHASVFAQFALFKAAKQDGFKVSLGGEGSDEIFLGYRKFLLFQAIAAMRSGRLSEIFRAAKGWPSIAGHLARQAPTYWNDRLRYLGAGLGCTLRLPPSAELPIGLSRDQDVGRRALADVTQWSLPTLLRYEDRNSMAHGIESRLPFLHHPLVELALSLTVADRLSGGLNKRVLREAMAGIVPDEIRLSKDKRSFPVAEGPWIDLGVGEALRSELRDHGGAARDWLVPGVPIDDLYSDSVLHRNPGALYEGVAALWLARNA